MLTLCPQHLRVSLKSADILVLDGQMSNATYLVGWRGIGLKTCNVQPAPTVSCHLLASAGHCIEEEWLPSFGLFPNPRMTDTNTKEMHLKPENYVKQTVGEFGTLDFFCYPRELQIEVQIQT